MNIDRKTILSNFGIFEIGNRELYQVLVDFVLAKAIRVGRYEGSEFIVEKIDPQSFLLIDESVYSDGRFEVNSAAYIGRDELSDLLRQFGVDWAGFDFDPPIELNVSITTNLSEDADIVGELAEALADDRSVYVFVREFVASPFVARGELEVAGLVVKKLGAGNLVVFQEQGPEGDAGSAAAIGEAAFAAVLDEAVLARGLVPVPGWPTERSLLRTKGGVRNEAKRISRAECARLLSSLDRSHYHVAVLDGALYQDWDSLADELADLYDFPMRDQRNPNAFLDWMHDLSWLGKQAYALFILNASQFMEDDPRKKKRIMAYFTRDILPFWDDGVERVVLEGKAKPFELYLVD